jgi:acyl carrier protein
MVRDFDDAKQRIRRKITELAAELGRDAARLRDDEPIPQTGLLDSASLMMLILWYETTFGISTEEEELTVDNFGTVDLMIDYLRRRG